MLMALPASAEVVFDGSLGQPGDIQGPDYEIAAERGRQVGDNLFHSFGRFNIGLDESATFTGPDAVKAVISRVTGGDLSRIDGVLSSAINGADLFFLNPAGVVFGPNAMLDVSGSFHVSTADFLQMGESERFYATPSEGEILSAAPPGDFGFLEGTPGRVVIDGHLEVEWGETLTIVGGDVDINGSLTSAEGRIQVKTQGDNTATLTGTIDVSGDRGGDVFIQAGRFYSSGGRIFAETYWDMDGGTVEIQAGSVDLEDGSLISGQTYDYGHGADVIIKAEDAVSLSGADEYGGASLVTTVTELEEEGAGDAGDIRLSGNRILLADGARITSSSIGDGAGGNISLTAQETIRLFGNDENGRGSQIESSGQGMYSGKAGDIEISAADIELTDGALVNSSTFGIGDGGDIALRAGRSVSFSGWDGNGQGSGVIARSDSLDAAAGNVSIAPMEQKTAISIDFQDGGWIGNTADGAGPGGNVSIDAGKGMIRFSGTDADGYASRIYTTALDAGNAGNIDFKAGDIRFSDGGGVTASTQGLGKAGRIQIIADHLEMSGGNPHGENKDGFGSGLYARTRTLDAGPGEAEGGNISIKVGKLVVKDGALITSNTKGTGNGGDINIQAGDIAIYGNGAGLIFKKPAESQQAWQAPVAASDIASGIYAGSEKAEGTAGDAGRVVIDADQIVLTDQGRITTAAENAGGGAMEISVDKRLFMENSRITTSVQLGAENGGDIAIADPEFIIINHSDIIARAYKGRGGNIAITSDQFIQSADSVVDASSKLGIDGNIEIFSPETNLSNVLTVLPANYLDASQWMETPCEARSGKDASRFIIVGPDGTPPPCDGVLGGPVLP